MNVLLVFKVILDYKPVHMSVLAKQGASVAIQEH